MGQNQSGQNFGQGGPPGGTGGDKKDQVSRNARSKAYSAHIPASFRHLSRPLFSWVWLSTFFANFTGRRKEKEMGTPSASPQGRQEAKEAGRCSRTGDKAPQCHAKCKVQVEAAKARTSEGLAADGGGVCCQPRAIEATGRKERGRSLQGTVMLRLMQARHETECYVITLWVYWLCRWMI